MHLRALVPLAPLAPLLLLLPEATLAQANPVASATRVDIPNCDNLGNCYTSTSTITVDFALPPPVIGQAGALFIGARATTGQPGDISNINTGTLGLWLFVSGAWTGINGGYYMPTAGFDAMPPAAQYVVVNQQDLCQYVSAGQNMELWAGYGVLTPDQVTMIDQDIFPATGGGVTYDDIRAAYVYTNMQQAGTYWNILGLTPDTCAGGGGGDGGCGLNGCGGNGG